MKTKTFKDFDFDESEGFKADARSLQDLSESQLEAAVHWFDSVDDFRDIGDSHNKSRKALDQQVFDGDSKKAANFLVATMYIIVQGNDNGDKVEDLLDDLVEAKVLDSQGTARLTRFFRGVWPRFEIVKTGFGRHLLSRRVTTELETVEAVCNLRPFMGNEFQPGKDNIETYAPHIDDYVVLASVRMVLKKGEEKKIVDFDLDQRTLATMLTTLQGTKMELDALEKVRAGLVKK